MARQTSELNRRQKQFVAEFLIDFNGAQAAIRCGYARSSARYQARDLLANPVVRAAIDAGEKQALEQSGVSRARVLRELAAVGLADIRKLYDERGNLIPLDQLDDATAASIAGIDVEQSYERGPWGLRRIETGRVLKIKRFDKTKALELLGRHLGLWSDPSPPAPEGPGLTVIVQNGVQVDGQRVTSAARVMVNLPTPE